MCLCPPLNESISVKLGAVGRKVRENVGTYAFIGPSDFGGPYQ